MQKLPSIIIGSMICSFIMVTIIACRENYTPKPPGYIKVDYPEKKYSLYDLNPAFRFEYPDYAVVIMIHPKP